MILKLLIMSFMLFMLSILVGGYLCAWDIEPKYAFLPTITLASTCITFAVYAIWKEI